MEYEPVIGLEVHAELQTHSKMFCGCAVLDSTTAAPNTAVCPVCAGLPGSLPVINARAVDFALQVALALHCEVPDLNLFARKNYFYPDLPKGYQISQYELPLAVNGWLEVETAGGAKRIRIRRVHLEEDTGKLLHAGPEHSLIDLNRAGVPLLEVVTEPDMSSVEEVRACGEALRAVLRYLGVNSGDMEKGVIRFEANVSVRPAGSSALQTRTEIKNLNSFRALERAVAYEIERQTRLWQSGGRVEQQTMGWSEAQAATVPQRGKEHAHDYRYFPEPDLPPLEVDRARLEQLRAGLPELPGAKRQRFERDYGLSRYDAALLVEDRAVADYFERAVNNPQSPDRTRGQAAIPRQNTGPGRNPKSLANWITGELFRLMNETGQEIGQVKVTPPDLAELAGLVADGTVNLNTAKSVLSEMFQTGRRPGEIVAARGLGQLSDNGAIQALVAEVLRENPAQVETYRAGKETVVQWFFGQVMRRLQGRGNPQIIRQALQAALDEARRAGAPE